MDKEKLTHYETELELLMKKTYGDKYNEKMKEFRQLSKKQKIEYFKKLEKAIKLKEKLIK